MSKHRRKGKGDMENNHQNMGERNNMMNNPFGIDPKQLLGMLGGNMDMGRLNNMLSSMNRDGFDFSSIAQMPGNNNNNNNGMNMNSNSNFNANPGQQGQQSQQNLSGGFNFNNLMNMMNGMTNNQNINANPANTKVDNSMNESNSDSISTNEKKMSDNLVNSNEEIEKRSHKRRHIDIKENIEEEDENIQMLRSLRNIVDPERFSFIDKVIELYSNGEFEEV